MTEPSDDAGNHSPGATRRRRHWVLPVIAVKAAIVAVVVLLPSGVAIGLGAAHAIAVVAVLVVVGLGLFVRHRAARGREGGTR